jgi:hypothetical protein
MTYPWRFRTLTLAACLLLSYALRSQAHVAPFVKGMFCEHVCLSSALVTEACSLSLQSKGQGLPYHPLTNLTMKDWWMHAYDGCRDQPPDEGVFLTLYVFSLMTVSSQVLTTRLARRVATSQSRWRSGYIHHAQPGNPAQAPVRNKACTTMSDNPDTMLGNFVSSPLLGFFALLTIHLQGNCRNYSASTYGNFANGSCIFQPNLHARSQSDAAYVFLTRFRVYTDLLFRGSAFAISYTVSSIVHILCCDAYQILVRHQPGDSGKSRCV